MSWAVPVERIGAQARQIQAGRLFLTALTAVFFMAGWVAFKVCAAVWLSVVWCAVATREGWREARVSSVKAARGTR